MRTEKLESVLEAQLVRVAPQLLLKVQRRVAGALRVVLVRDRGAEERHDAVAGVLVDRALEAVNASARIWKKRSRILCHSSGSTCSASSIEPFTSAKRTVTCLRSPSRALREVRIFSARCFAPAHNDCHVDRERSSRHSPTTYSEDRQTPLRDLVDKSSEPRCRCHGIAYVPGAPTRGSPLYGSSGSRPVFHCAIAQSSAVAGRGRSCKW